MEKQFSDKSYFFKLDLSSGKKVVVTVNYNAKTNTRKLIGFSAANFILEKI